MDRATEFREVTPDELHGVEGGGRFLDALVGAVKAVGKFIYDRYAK